MKGAHSLFPSPATGDASVLVNNSHNSNQGRISMRKHRLIVLCLGLCALLMLAGCGSDGSVGLPIGDEGGGTVDMMALGAAKMAAMAAYDAAKKALSDVEDDKSADMDSYDKAKARVAEAKDANDKAQAAETVADAEKYQKMAEDANTEVMKYADMVTTAANSEADKATTAMIEGLTKAIADPDGDGTFPEDNELRTSRRPGSEPTYASGGVTTVGNDILGKNDVNILNSEEFNVVASATRASISGFSESVYERTKSGKTDTLTIYTDATSDKDEPFNVYYADVSGTDRNGISATADATTPATGKTAYRRLTFETTAANLAQIAEKMRGPRIPENANGHFAVEAGEDGAFMGTFDGIPGTYSCISSACEIVKDDDGRLSITGGPLTFTPSTTTNDTEDVHMVKGVTKDTDYVSFGYWVQTSTKSDGSTVYGVNTFAGGLLPFGTDPDIGNNPAIMALEGSATYEGSATGMYARKALAIDDNGTVVGTPDAAGQFVADVELMANFGVSQKVSQNDAFDISGTASNFQDVDGNVIDSGWTLDLNAASFGEEATIGTVTEASNRFSGTTGKGGTMGQWRGQFFGMPGTGDAASSTHPSSVAGEFTGHFDDGHVIGAFGATSQDE